jgi:cell division protein FtsB
MLNTLNTKILLAIFAVMLAIAGAVGYHRHEEMKAAELGEQQQYQQLRQQVEKNKKKLNSGAANEGKTWQKYLP